MMMDSNDKTQCVYEIENETKQKKAQRLLDTQFVIHLWLYQD